MRSVAVVLVLLLAGCASPAAPTVSTSPEDALSTEIGALDGVDDVSVSSVEYSDGRETAVLINMATSETEGFTDLADAVASLIDAAPFGDETRELKIAIDGSLLLVGASGGTKLDASPRAELFVHWLTDTRVEAVSWTSQLVVELVGDGTTDGSLVETIYSELADPTTLDDGGLRIDDPGSYSVGAAQHPYTENRFGVAREIAALDGVSDCSFSLKASEDGSFIHQIFCSVDGDAEATGTQINALLDARGLRESTDVRLQTPDDSILTNDGSYVVDES